NSWADHEQRPLNTLMPTHGLSIDVKPFSVRLHFHGDLDFFLGSRIRRRNVERSLTEKTSIKDVIESCGVPHPEVNLIVVNGDTVDFDYNVMSDAEFEVYQPGIQSQQYRNKSLLLCKISQYIEYSHHTNHIRHII